MVDRAAPPLLAHEIVRPRAKRVGGPVWAAWREGTLTRTHIAAVTDDQREALILCH